MSNLYIGVMSGTSLDGIDITLCEIDKSVCKMLYSYEATFDESVKEQILEMIEGQTTLREVGSLNSQLGHIFADALNDFLKKYAINPQDITAIGLHGQTLWHEPDAKFAFSMQLGCPNVVSAKTGIKVIADFRSMDIANGGEGAPFAPAFHKEIFASLQKNVAVVNIGGMANITLLGEELKGWDSGCGNVLLDLWIQRTLNERYDRDGAFAKRGRVEKQLLQSMLEDEYFKKLPPKSTGREYFNQTWLERYLATFDTLSDVDIQRTLLELTAKSIVQDILKTSTKLIIVCGGGAKNGFLMQRLKDLSQLEVQSSDTFGVSSDFMESMAFAWLAYKRVQREEVVLSDVTGARKNSVLGGEYFN